MKTPVTAKFLRRVDSNEVMLEGHKFKWGGEARLYELDREVQVEDSAVLKMAADEGVEVIKSRHVVVSNVARGANGVPAVLVMLTDDSGTPLRGRSHNVLDILVTMECLTDPEAPLRALGWNIERALDGSAN